MLRLTDCLPQTNGQISSNGNDIPEQIHEVRSCMASARHRSNSFQMYEGAEQQQQQPSPPDCYQYWAQVSPHADEPVHMMIGPFELPGNRWFTVSTKICSVRDPYSRLLIQSLEPRGWSHAAGGPPSQRGRTRGAVLPACCLIDLTSQSAGYQCGLHLCY